MISGDVTPDHLDILSFFRAFMMWIGGPPERGSFFDDLGVRLGPRINFTTEEDLESEEAKSREGESLSPRLRRFRVAVIAYAALHF
jgi:hypothetical protein